MTAVMCAVRMDVCLQFSEDLLCIGASVKTCCALTRLLCWSVSSAAVRFISSDVAHRRRQDWVACFELSTDEPSTDAVRPRRS